MCLAQGHNAVTPVRLEPAALRSRVKHSTTEPLRSLLSMNRYFTLHWYLSSFIMNLVSIDHARIQKVLSEGVQLWMFLLLLIFVVFVCFYVVVFCCCFFNCFFFGGGVLLLLFCSVYYWIEDPNATLKGTFRASETKRPYRFVNFRGMRVLTPCPSPFLWIRACRRGFHKNIHVLHVSSSSQYVLYAFIVNLTNA